MNIDGRNTIRVVANAMLSDAALLSNRSAFSCIVLANRVHAVHLNSTLVGSLTESSVHSYVETLGKMFVSYIQLHPDSLGFDIGVMPSLRGGGAFVHMLSDYGKSDVYSRDERFVLARKAWLKFVTKQ